MVPPELASAILGLIHDEATDAPDDPWASIERAERVGNTVYLKYKAQTFAVTVAPCDEPKWTTWE